MRRPMVSYGRRGERRDGYTGPKSRMPPVGPCGVLDVGMRRGLQVGTSLICYCPHDIRARLVVLYDALHSEGEM